MVNEACAGDSLERRFILGTTNSVAYAFNAWIPLLSYDTRYAPRFLVGNSVTVGLIICAAMTLTLAIFLQRRDLYVLYYVPVVPKWIVLTGAGSSIRCRIGRTGELLQ